LSKTEQGFRFLEEKRRDALQTSLRKNVGSDELRSNFRFRTTGACGQVGNGTEILSVRGPGDS
jgi:hypothetical protein